MGVVPMSGDYWVNPRKVRSLSRERHPVDFDEPLGEWEHTGRTVISYAGGYTAKVDLPIEEVARRLNGGDVGA